MGVLTTSMENCRICSSFIYYQPPRFHTGHGTVLGCLGLWCVNHRVVIVKKYNSFIHVMGSIVCASIMMWTYTRLNKEKEELCAREGINESMTEMYRDLADKSPLFR
jgi:hypothetical protein